MLYQTGGGWAIVFEGLNVFFFGGKSYHLIPYVIKKCIFCRQGNPFLYSYCNRHSEYLSVLGYQHHNALMLKTVFAHCQKLVSF